jgi:GNAT superfamily N-acetyltransferase
MSVSIEITGFYGPELLTTVRQIRFAVLREQLGMPFESTLFVGDELPDTLHLIAQLVDRPLGCLTVMFSSPNPNSMGDKTGMASAQLRGMAVLEAHQRQGVGRQLLIAAHKIVDAKSIELWCKARMPAVGFYERNGWETEGNIFEVPNIGPHIQMSRKQKK